MSDLTRGDAGIASETGRRLEIESLRAALGPRPIQPRAADWGGDIPYWQQSRG
jgi:hypothetical protein